MNEGSRATDAPETDPARGSAASSPVPDPPPSALRWVEADYAVKGADPALTDDPSLDDEEAQRARAQNGKAADAKPMAIPPLDLTATDANDTEAPRVDEPTKRVRLADRAMLLLVIKFLRARYKIDNDRAYDVLHSASVRALESNRWPLDAAKTTPWFYTIARYTHVDDVRARVRLQSREKLQADAGVRVPVHMDHEPEPPDNEEFLRRVHALDPKLAELIRDVLAYEDGKPVEEIAADRNMKPSAMYARLQRGRALIRKRWPELISAVAVGFAILFWLLRSWMIEPNLVTAGHKKAAPNAPLLALPPHPDPAALRSDGLRACELKYYEQCLEDLNHARRLDPEGDKDAAVTAARQKAEEILKP
jgi:DNA-directed RNA polymerase specialized sigma24 family protein